MLLTLNVVHHLAACSKRMRRTSLITAGLSWHRCPEDTSSSDAAPSRCALSYGTIPSLPPALGGSWWTAMMEWAFMPAAML